MAEDFVTRDQHRADLAELRLEIANSLASLDKRTELIAHALQARTELILQDLQSFKQQTQQGFAEVRTDIQDLRQDMRRMDGRLDTAQKQLWVMVGVVVFAVLTGVIKLVFFP